MRKSVNSTLRVLLSGCRRLERSKYVWYYKANTFPLFARVKISLNTEFNLCYIFGEKKGGKNSLII